MRFVVVLVLLSVRLFVVDCRRFRVLALKRPGRFLGSVDERTCFRGKYYDLAYALYG